MESNLFKIDRIDDHLGQFVRVFRDKGDAHPDQTIFDETRLRWMEKCERFGLQLFKQDHLYQYLDYLRGLQMELEVGDFYTAKAHYINSLVERAYANHRIRKESLLRLMGINKKIGFPKDSPEKILITRYYVKQKYTQVILDTSSFPNTKTLKSTMNLPKMLFNDLEPQDFFGLKILKNGFDPDEAARNAGAAAHAGGPTQPSNRYLQDVIVLEEKKMHATVKARYLDDFTDGLQAHDRASANFARLNGRDAQLEMQKQTTLAIQKTIDRMAAVAECNVQEVHGEQIKGPMKWIVLILGPNHQARDLESLLHTEHKNLNIIVVLVTSNGAPLWLPEGQTAPFKEQAKML